MKKLIITTVVVCVLGACVTLVGVNSVQANKGLFDFNYEFNYCQIKMPDGSVVEGKVDKWWDYEDGDQLQVKIDGKVYLTHASNMVLMYK